MKKYFSRHIQILFREIKFIGKDHKEYDELMPFNVLPSFEVQYTKFTKVPPKERRTYSVLVALYMPYLMQKYNIETTKKIVLYNSELISSKSKKYIKDTTSITLQ